MQKSVKYSGPKMIDKVQPILKSIAQSDAAIKPKYRGVPLLARSL